VHYNFTIKNVKWGFIDLFLEYVTNLTYSMYSNKKCIGTAI